MADLPILAEVHEIDALSDEDASNSIESGEEVQPSLEPEEEEEIMPFMEKPIGKVRRGQPKAKPKRMRKKVVANEGLESGEIETPAKTELSQRQLDTLAKAREAKKVKSDYKKRTPQLKQPPALPQPIRERFNTHLLPNKEAVADKQLQDEHVSFMKFMGHMDQYNTVKHSYKAKQAKKVKPDAVLPPTLPSAAPQIPETLRPPANNPYSSYFG
jgi:hypothetical protein